MICGIVGSECGGYHRSCDECIGVSCGCSVLNNFKFQVNSAMA